MIDGKRLCDNTSHPLKDIYPMLFGLTIVKGNCFINLFSAIIVMKDFISTISFSIKAIIEQPDRIRVFKHFSLYISLGRLLRLVQSFKFSSIRLQRHAIEECISRNLGQSLRMSCSRLGSLEKSGVSIKCLE